jgi:3-hydroxybutyryl-CoA dehydrogenase
MKVAVIGSGKMGLAIFKLISGKSFHLTLVAIDEDEAKNQEQRFVKGLERQLKRGAINESDFLRQKETIRFTHRLEDLSATDLIIEAIFENYDQKVVLFQDLEDVIAKNAVLVSNTSSISIEDLAGNLKYKDRFSGLHFFHPVLLIGVVEIIRWVETPAELVGFLKGFCKNIGKRAIAVEDAPASLINAILSYYYVEALYILEEGGALPSRVDELAKRFVYIGPCESMDVVGLDFFLAGLRRAATPGSLLPIDWTDDAKGEIPKEDLGGREGFHVPSLFRKLVAENRLGRKVSHGIYLYEKDKPVDDSPEFYVNPARRVSAGDSGVSDEVAAKRLLYSIFNGAIYCVQRGMSTLEELDFGIKEVLLMKQGPFTMMKAMGEEDLRREFDFLTHNVGKRFRQTGYDFLKGPVKP